MVPESKKVLKTQDTQTHTHSRMRFIKGTQEPTERVTMIRVRTIWSAKKVFKY